MLEPGGKADASMRLMISYNADAMVRHSLYLSDITLGLPVLTTQLQEVPSQQPKARLVVLQDLLA